MAGSIAAASPDAPPLVRSDDSLGQVEKTLVDLGRQVADREEHMRAEGDGRASDTRLHRPLDMVDDEPSVLGVVRKALAYAESLLSVELILADSSPPSAVRWPP